jgi:asparagine synthase (glutamine-hydrolysing)
LNLVRKIVEIYENNGLISETAWQQVVLSLQNEVAHAPTSSLEDLKQQWIAAFETAVLSRVATGKNGLLFSGGVDSTFIGYILAKHKIPFTCYTVGFKDPKTKEPEDIIEAKRVAAYYGWGHKYVVLSLEEFEPLVIRSAQILKDAANPVSVGVSIVVLAAAELAARDGVTHLFGGLGSEEIFAGYHRHDAANKNGVLDEEAWRGLFAMYQRDLIRDSCIGQSIGINVPTPFMDSAVIRIAMQFPAELKIKEKHKKYILRVMAQEQGLEEQFAFRPKRAAQYGSRTHKVLSRLAKRAGKSEEEYIQSLVISSPKRL